MTAANVTPPYFRYLIRVIRPFPDFDFSFIKPLRARAAALLNLAPGARVSGPGLRARRSLPVPPPLRGTRARSSESRSVRRSRHQRRGGVSHGTNGAMFRSSWPQPRRSLCTGCSTASSCLVLLMSTLLKRPWTTSYLTSSPTRELSSLGQRRRAAVSDRFLNPLLRGLFPRLSFRTTPVPDHEPWRLWRPPRGTRHRGVFLRMAVPRIRIPGGPLSPAEEQ